MLLWPNRITLLRILSLPFLFWLAIEHRMLAFACVFFLIGATDWVDGLVARWRKEESAFGARFDSFADLIFNLATLAWVWLLFPKEFGAHRAILLAMAFFLICA